SNVEVKTSGIHGKGVFARKRIRNGTAIIEYTGERIGLKEADKRYEGRESTYLFMIHDDLYIDGLVGGNAARFINHSCQPNCEAYLEGDNVVIHAIKNIQPGAELSYDYQLYIDDPDDRSAEYPCKCGHGKCRGTLLGEKNCSVFEAATTMACHET